MAEIKSTLDLIMEKTKHLTLSAAEKESLEREEQLKKLPGHVQRFLDNSLTLPNLMQALDEVPRSLHREIHRELVSLFVGAFRLSARGEKCLDALRELSGGQDQPRIQQLRSLLERFEASRVEMAAVQAHRMRAELADLGIAGSAVVVRGEGSPVWQTLEHEYIRELNEVKSAWLRELAERT
jgi:hypothetical protein